MHSSDGVHWSTPRLVFHRPNHGIVSPSIARVPGVMPSVWYVDAGPSKCVQRTTRVLSQQSLTISALEPGSPEQGWTAARRVALDQPSFYIWHLDVNWVPSRHEYWAIYPAYKKRVCGERSLFFARSADGVKWTTYKVPFMRPSDVPWMSMTVYRTTFLYDPQRDVIRLWISASALHQVWSLSYVEYNFSSFLAALEKGGAESPMSGSTGLLSNAFRSIEDDGP
jgi:hypothetical protein